MKELQALLAIRQKKKRKFLRQQASIYSKLKGWRKPKGLHSKMRRHFAGHRKMPNIGYRAPKVVRYLSQEGLKIRFVQTEKDIQNLEPGMGVILSSRLGLKKKISLLEQLKKISANVLNIDIDKFMTTIAKTREEAKKSKKEKVAKKEASKAKEKVKEPGKEENKSKTGKFENEAEQLDEQKAKREQMESEKRKVLEKRK